MKIAAVLAGNPKMLRATDIYRITMPLSQLNLRGWECSWFPNTAVIDVDVQRRMMEADLLVMARPITNSPNVAKRSAAPFKGRLVYETDDDLTAEYRQTGEMGASSIPFLEVADFVTVSTQPLADQVRKYTDAKIWVLPNCIHVAPFQQASLSARRLHPEFTVSLVGTPSHKVDWEPAYRAAIRFLDNYPGTRLMVGGFTPDYVDGSRVDIYKPVAYPQYPAMLRQADVVLCSLDPNDSFNASKSAVKALEAWSAIRPVGNSELNGAAVIATDCIVYNTIVKDGVNGLLVEQTEEAWYRAIERVYQDDALRRRITRKGTHLVETKFSIANNWHNWKSAYKTMIQEGLP